MVMNSKENPHDGSTLEDWLRDEGILNDVKGEAARRIKRWQLEKEMKKRGEAGKGAPQQVRRRGSESSTRRGRPEKAGAAG